MPQGRRTIRIVAAPALALALLAPTASTASPAPSAPAAVAPAAAPQLQQPPVRSGSRAPRSTRSRSPRPTSRSGWTTGWSCAATWCSRPSPTASQCGKVPVLLTITAYNKSVIGAGAGAILAGSDPKYFVKRGYALARRRRPRHRLVRRHLEGVQRPRVQGRRSGRRVGAPRPLEQRQRRHDGGVLHGHLPDLRRLAPARRAEGDLPAGAGRRRLPRHRRVRRPDRRGVHPPVARPGDRHRPDPAGVRHR